MSKKGTLALLALLVGLCAAYWGMVQLEKRGKDQQARGKKMFDFAPEDVTAIEIHQFGQAPVAANRAAPGEWAITKPRPDIEPNPIVWERAANTLAALDNARTIDTGGDLAAYGLDKPVLLLTADLAGRRPLRFEFGAVDPTQAYRYARLDGQQVFLVSVEQFHELDRSLDLLRDRRLVKTGEEGISRIEFSRFRTPKNLSGDPDQQPTTEESVTVAVEKQPDGRWRMVAPESAPANQELVDQIVREIQYSMIVGFIEKPESLEDYGLDPPKARLTVYSGAGSDPQTILMGLRSEHETAQGCFYAKTAAKPAVFLMDPNVVAILPQTPNAFREDRLFTRDASRLAAINYKTADTDIRLENDPEKGWRLVRPAAEETDQVAVSNFIAFIKQIAGGSFPDASPERFGFDSPRIAIRCEFKEGDPSEILVGAPVPGTGQYYVRQDNGVTTILSELEVHALTKTVHDFEEKTLLRFDKLAAAKVELQLDGDDYVFEKFRGRWVIVKPENRAFTTSRDMDPLIEELSGLRAVKRLGDLPAEFPEAGLDAPVATVTVTAAKEGEDPAVLGPVKIGAATAEESQYRYATSALRPGVYLVGQSLMDEIRDTVKAIRTP